MLPNFLLQLTLFLKIAIAGLILLAAARDIMTRTVSNWIPASLAVLSATLTLVELRPLWGFGFGFAIFVLCLLCWKRGWMGGADVKLLGAVAIAVPPSDTATFMLGVTLFGGVLAVGYLAGRYLVPRPTPSHSRNLLARVWRVEAWRIRHRGPLPYACAIAAGTLCVLS